MAVGTTAEVLRRRLATQRLLGHGATSAVDVVRLLTCVQSQEYAHAFWSLGMRTTGHGYAAVQREFDDGRFLRTHILRPTWHFVAAEDLHWVLALTSPRVQQTNGSMYRRLGLTARDLDRGTEVILAALGRSRYLTRAELRTVLADAGLLPPGSPDEGLRLVYLVMNAELEAAICSGPLRGAQHTYAAVSERVPPPQPSTEEQRLAELTLRFFGGHGPAEVKDLTRWSSLTVAQATAGLELVRDRLDSVTVADHRLWFDPAVTADPSGSPEVDSGSPYPPGALLLPLYDEVTLSYPQVNFPLAPDHPHPPDTDLFVGTVLVEGVNAGTWRRTVRGRRVRVETSLAPGLDPSGRAAVADAVHRLATFLGKELEQASGG